MSCGEKSVHLPIELLAALGDDPATWYPDLRVETIICDAIRAWIAPAPTAQAQQPSAAADAGYQWKQVFLPDGTRLRAKFGRETWHATVQEGEIKYGEHLVSPSCFANLHGSGNRNAWKAVWLRFPGTEQWVLADTCRTMQKAAIARLFDAAAAQEEHPSRARQSQSSQPRGTHVSPAASSATHPATPREATAVPAGAPAPSPHPGAGHAQNGKGNSKRNSKRNGKRRRRRKWHAAKKVTRTPAGTAPATPQAATRQT